MLLVDQAEDWDKCWWVNQWIRRLHIRNAIIFWTSGKLKCESVTFRHSNLFVTAAGKVVIAYELRGIAEPSCYIRTVMKKKIFSTFFECVGSLKMWASGVILRHPAALQTEHADQDQRTEGKWRRECSTETPASTTTNPTFTTTRMNGVSSKLMNQMKVRTKDRMK